jgi:hypothetical protein
VYLNVILQFSLANVIAVRPETHERWIYLRATHVLSNGRWVSVQTSVGLRAFVGFKVHVIKVVWPFYLVLRIIKKRNRTRWCGYTHLAVNDILMASATHYIPVSEKTVINSLITSINLQPPSMNFYVIKNSVMRKNTNMRCEIALQVKLYELPKQWATDSYLHLMKENGDQQHKVLINVPIFLTMWEQ